MGFPDIMNLPADPSRWRFDRIDHDSQMGTSVIASTGEGDMTFSFEVNSHDPTLEKAARDHGFPQFIIETTLKYLRGF